MEVRLSPLGRPLEDFLFDPPIVIDKEDLGLASIGVKVMEDPNVPGLHHVWDVVGSDNYPNVLDIYREIKRHGASRKVSPSLDFSLLSPDSRLMLVHDRAWIDNADVLRQLVAEENTAIETSYPPSCPTHQHAHTTIDAGMCVGLWGEVVTGGTEVSRLENPYVSPRTVLRTVGSTEYTARCAPDGFKPTFKPALFLSLKLTNIVVVDDELNEDGTESKFALISQSSLDCEVVDE